MARPCSAGKASVSNQLENAPFLIAPASGADQTLVVRVVVEQPYIDNVATHVTYDGLDREFIIGWDRGFIVGWELDKQPGKLHVHESLVTEDRVVADILDCTDKGVSMPARFTPVTAPRLLPYLIQVREKWSRQFDEGTASSAQIGAVAMVMLMRLPAGPVAAPAAGAATTSRGQVATTAKPVPAPKAISAAPGISAGKTTPSVPATNNPTPAATGTNAKPSTGTVVAGEAGAIELGVENAATVLSSASQAYKGSTRLGHALSKHAGRNPALWGRVTGNPSTWHQQALQHFEDIVAGPGSFNRVTDPKTGLQWIEKVLPDGRGIRLELDYTFKGFLN